MLSLSLLAQTDAGAPSGGWAFEAAEFTPGLYSVTAFDQRFRRRELPRVRVEAGSIALGTPCSYVGDVPEDFMRIDPSYVTMKLGCAVDLDSEGDTICSGRNVSESIWALCMRSARSP